MSHLADPDPEVQVAPPRRKPRDTRASLRFPGRASQRGRCLPLEQHARLTIAIGFLMQWLAICCSLPSDAFMVAERLPP